MREGWQAVEGGMPGQYQREVGSLVLEVQMVFRDAPHDKARWIIHEPGVWPAVVNDIEPTLALAQERAEVVAEALTRPLEGERFDLVAHIRRQSEWSEATFGPGPRPAQVVDHIRKELKEIERDPADLSEWCDVVAMALDGARRAGHSAEEIARQLAAKLETNKARRWPDWRTADRTKAIEHIREEA